MPVGSVRTTVPACDRGGVAIIIGFRDRGGDPLRTANLERVLHHWCLYPAPVIIADDGRYGDAQFCRSAAYNLGSLAASNANILVYTESDMLIRYEQIDEAIKLAAEQTGLVVPFTQRHNLSPEDSEHVRSLKRSPQSCVPASTDNANYGCINIISRETLQAIGRWDETMNGWGHDDCAMWLAFEKAAGPTRWVVGDAYHLYHQPPITGTSADRAATMANYRRMQLYAQAKTPDQIRHLTAGGKGLSRNWRGQLQ